MLKIATDYYKSLFCYEDRLNISLMHDFFHENEKVTMEENGGLEDPFAESEVKKAVFESYSDGAPGPDGLSFMFYQTFWDIAKVDLMAMFHELENDELELFRLNFAMITLVPKENDAKVMSKLRPISLLNCCFKNFTKVLTNRLAIVIDRLIASNQAAFIKGRYILESVVTAHEILHSIHHQKLDGLVIKLDYEKAYDKVNLDFLGETLKLRGFGNKLQSWIYKIVHQGSVGLKINNVEGNFFITGKGLTQEDPLSPSSF